MPKQILVLPFALALVAGAVTPGHAVRCDSINRELKLGRWPEDVALGMGITLADVNDCKSRSAPASTQKTSPSRSSSETPKAPAQKPETKGK